MRRSLFATTIVFASAGCDQGSDGPRTTVRDSAGVRIVESSLAALAGGATFRVEPEPLVVIGAREGPDEQMLNRVMDATALPDGSVAIVNSGAAEVVVFGRDGTLVRRIGRRGEGPGEFAGPRWAALRGDTLLVYDPFQGGGRLSAFSIDGTLLGSENLTVEGLDFPNPSRILSDGAFLDERSEGSIGWDEVGHVVYSRWIIRYPRSGERVDTLARVPGGEGFKERLGNGIAQSPVPFGRESRTAAGSDRVWVGNGHAMAIEAFDLTGRHRLSVRMDVEPTPVSGDHRDRWIEATLSGSVYQARPDATDRLRRRFLEAPLPATMPVHAELVVDAEDRLWVKRYAPPWDATNEWWIFGPDGGLLGGAELPAGLDVFEIGRDYVLGLMRDELDVESVRLFAMTEG